MSGALPESNSLPARGFFSGAARVDLVQGSEQIRAGSQQTDAGELTGGQGRLPISIVTDNTRSPEHIYALAHRCIHGDGPKHRPWGCSHGRMAKTVRAGYSRPVHQRAMREAIKAGDLEREIGKHRSPGKCTRGRGFAIDRLTFDRPEKQYVKVSRHLFDGSLTPKEITVALLLEARGRRLTEPWQVARRLSRTCKDGKRAKAARGTVNAVMKTLVAKGLAKNFGSQEKPLWGSGTVQNPALEKSTLKKAGVEKTTRTHLLVPSRQSVQHIKFSQHTSEEAKTEKGTDAGDGSVARKATGLIAESVRGSATDARRNRITRKCRMVLDAPGVEDLSEDARRSIEAMGKDPDEYRDRALNQKDKGTKIGSMDRYCVESASRDVQKETGADAKVVMDLATGNTSAKQAAYVKMLGADVDPCSAARRELAARQQTNQNRAKLAELGRNGRAA